LDHGAVIVASNQLEDYPVIPPLPSYGWVPLLKLKNDLNFQIIEGSSREGERLINRYASLIHGEYLTNVTISGSGTIDGRGQFWYDMKEHRGHAPKLEHGRPALIELLWSSKIQIRNISMINSPFWTIHPTYCDDVVIDGVSIINAGDSPNTDGIDIDSSVNVVITNNFITCGDDNVAIKSGLGTPYPPLF